MNRAKGKSVCAVVSALLFCTLIIGVTEGQLPEPTGSFTTIPVALKASEPFDVNLTVQIDPSVIYTTVYGWFSVVDSTKSIAYGPIYWWIDFDGLYPKTVGYKIFAGVFVSSEGDYFLSTDVYFNYLATMREPWKKTFVETPIYVAPAEAPVPSYTVVWLQKPDENEAIRAGKLIRLRFQILDESLESFVLRHDVRIEVRNATGSLIVEATCGKRSGSICTNSNGEYYRWYWKTTSDLPEGEYSVTVLLNGANLSGNSIQITIVS